MQVCFYRERRKRIVHARDSMGDLLVNFSIKNIVTHAKWWEIPLVLYGKLWIRFFFFPACDKFLTSQQPSDVLSEVVCAACDCSFKDYPPWVTPCPGCKMEGVLREYASRIPHSLSEGFE